MITSIILKGKRAENFSPPVSFWSIFVTGLKIAGKYCIFHIVLPRNHIANHYQVMLLKFRISILGLFLSICLFGQQDAQQIQLKRGTLPIMVQGESFSPYVSNFSTVKDGGSYYIVLRFNETKSRVDRENLFINKGIELLGFLGKDTYLVRLQEEVLYTLNPSELGINALTKLSPWFKIAPTLADAEGEVQVNVGFAHRMGEDKIRKDFASLFQSWEKFPVRGKMVRLTISAKDLDKLAAIPYVVSISPTAKPGALIAEAIESHHVPFLNHPSGLNLTGNGISVAVGDGGMVSTHQDLDNRIQNAGNVGVSDHGALCAGIMVGEGNLYSPARGVAPSASLYEEYYENLIYEDSTYFFDHNVIVTSNSYGKGVVFGTCVDAGNYDEDAEDIDFSLRELPEVTHVFAAGNDGSKTCGSYAKGYGTVKNAWNSAKNPIIVGNIRDDNNLILSTSSRGPTKDGRIKPEIVAVGRMVFGPNSDNNYGQGTGTSFATPMVAGIATLLQEQHNNLHGTNARGDLIKAILCNTAEDLGNPGPDFIYGYGKANAYRATKVLNDGAYVLDEIGMSGQNTHTISVPSGASSLKVMLYWHDKEALPLATKTLVNDLDLQLVDPGSVAHLPLILDTLPSNVGNFAVPGVDRMNNMEQVVIDNPAAGTYNIQIDGFDVPFGPQNYVVVYEVIQEHLALTSVLGGEEYSPGEQVKISWEAAGHDSQDFTLEYSIDNGSTWTTISAALAGTNRYFIWTVPDAITDQGLVRVTWNGTGLSAVQSFTNFNIMNEVTGLSLSEDCSGGGVLNWSATTNATSYDVLQFSGGVATVLTNTTDLSYPLTGLTIGEKYVFSVRAVSSTGLLGRNTVPVEFIPKGLPSGIINTFPYEEDFETDDGGWFTSGKNGTWEWGSPANTVINHAARGDKCWVTNLSGDYNSLEWGYLYTPCFDVSALANPMMSMALIVDTEDNEDTDEFPFDYLFVEYSTDGLNWVYWAASPSNTNWYNNEFGWPIWEGTEDWWHTVSEAIPPDGIAAGKIMFRFLMYSDSEVVQEGAGIDYFTIYDNIPIYSGPSNDALPAQSVSGSDWVHFDVAGERLFSIHPNGENLGNTEIEVSIIDTLRDDGVQYYLGRNWNILPEFAPTGPISVRAYFTDAEMDSLRLGNGDCLGCYTLNEAFMAGVTRYTGQNKDLVLEDNELLGFDFLANSNVVVTPYDKGYCIEFEIADSSECYINALNHLIAPDCNDGFQNGDETDIDCGGTVCDPCPTCDDGIMNGTEIDIDCGGLECPLCPCPEPANVTVLSNSGQRVTVSWDNDPDAISYQIRYKLQGDPDWIKIGNSPGNDFKELYPMELGGTYVFQVRKQCSAGNWSLFSTPAVIFTMPICDYPTSLSYFQLGSGYHRFTWDAMPTAIKYQIQHRPVGGTWTSGIGTTPGNDFKSLIESTFIPGNEYQFRVRTLCELDPSIGKDFWSLYSPPVNFVAGTATTKLSGVESKAMSVYPNPTGRDIHILWDGFLEGNVNIELLNIQGKVIDRLYLLTKGGELKLDVGDLSAGCYFIRLTTEKGEQSHSKFIKR